MSELSVQPRVLLRALAVGASAMALMGSIPDNAEAHNRVVQPSDVAYWEQDLDSLFKSVVPTPQEAARIDTILPIAQQYWADNPPQVGPKPEDGYFCKSQQDNWRQTGSIRIVPDKVMNVVSDPGTGAETYTEYSSDGRHLCRTYYQQSTVDGDLGYFCMLGTHETGHAEGLFNDVTKGHDPDPTHVMNSSGAFKQVIIPGCEPFYKKTSQFFTPLYLAKHAIHRKGDTKVSCRSERVDKFFLRCKSLSPAATAIKRAHPEQKVKKTDWEVQTFQPIDGQVPYVKRVLGKSSVKYFNEIYDKSIPSSTVTYSSRLFTK